jgi:hypothetical protein
VNHESDAEDPVCGPAGRDGIRLLRQIRGRGARHAVPRPTFYTSGTNIAVEQFQWANGTWTTNGHAKIDNKGYAKGTGNDINANNVNLRFRFDYPLKKITLKFGELGGNNNMLVNGDFRNVGNLVSLNGATVGGVNVAVNATQQGGNWYGIIVLDGAIKEFSIGGQELWLDEICPTK